MFFYELRQRLATDMHSQLGKGFTEEQLRNQYIARFDRMMLELSNPVDQIKFLLSDLAGLTSNVNELVHISIHLKPKSKGLFTSVNIWAEVAGARVSAIMSQIEGNHPLKQLLDVINKALQAISQSRSTPIQQFVTIGAATDRAAATLLYLFAVSIGESSEAIRSSYFCHTHHPMVPMLVFESDSDDVQIQKSVQNLEIGLSELTRKYGGKLAKPACIGRRHGPFHTAWLPTGYRELKPSSGGQSVLAQCAWLVPIVSCVIGLGSLYLSHIRNWRLEGNASLLIGLTLFFAQVIAGVGHFVSHTKPRLSHTPLWSLTMLILEVFIFPGMTLAATLHAIQLVHG